MSYDTNPLVTDFSIDTKICEEEYMRTSSGMEKATFYELVLTIYGQYDSYKIKYIFNNELQMKLCLVVFILQLTNPCIYIYQIKIYLNHEYIDNK